MRRWSCIHSCVLRQARRQKVVPGRPHADSLLLLNHHYAALAAPMWHHHVGRLRKSPRLQAIVFHVYATVSRTGADDARIFDAEDEKKFLEWRTAGLPYNRELRRMEETYQGAAHEHEAWLKQAEHTVGTQWGQYDLLKRMGCACSDDKKAVEVGKELFEERLDQVWPDRKKADLSGESGSDMPPAAGGDDRIALLNTLEEKALKNAHGVYLIGPTARRAAANGGYRPQCPAEPVEGLPPECPSPTALSRLADDLDVEGEGVMMDEEATRYEEAATIGVEVDSGDDDDGGVVCVLCGRIFVSSPSERRPIGDRGRLRIVRGAQPLQ